MKKIDYLLIIGLCLIVLSIISFIFLRENVTPNCTNSITCGKAINYFDSLKVYEVCTLECALNANNQTFNIPNQNFIIFVRLGILFIGLWTIVRLSQYAIKFSKKIIKNNSI